MAWIYMIAFQFFHPIFCALNIHSNKSNNAHVKNEQKSLYTFQIATIILAEIYDLRFR